MASGLGQSSGKMSQRASGAQMRRDACPMVGSSSGGDGSTRRCEKGIEAKAQAEPSRDAVDAADPPALLAGAGASSPSSQPRPGEVRSRGSATSRGASAAVYGCQGMRKRSPDQAGNRWNCAGSRSIDGTMGANDDPAGHVRMQRVEVVDHSNVIEPMREAIVGVKRL